MERVTVLKGAIIPDFYLPTELYIKPESINELGTIIKHLGSRAVIITTSSDLALFHDTVENMSRSLSKAGIGFIIFDEIPDTPNTEYVDSAVYFTKKTNCDIIIGFGGIDSINLAKAVSVLSTNYLFCEDLFSNPDIKPGLPLVTIPAYPLFGFEILPLFFTAGIHEPEKKVYGNRHLYPSLCVTDPQVCIKIDDETTAYSGLSSLAIATESVISKSTNGMVNTYALKAIDLTFKNLPLVFKEPQNIPARQQLSHASIMSGIAFSVAKLSISLSIALALSSRTDLPVTRAMSVILPHVMEYNLTASPGKYVQMSKVMDEDVREITVIEAAIKAVEGVRKLEMDLNVPQRLSQFDIPKSEFTRMAEIAITYPFIESAPRTLTRDEIETILIAAY